MPGNNCFQKVLIKNVCGPMSSENGIKHKKEYQIVTNLNKTSVLNCWLGKQDVASQSPLEHRVFYFSFIFCYYMNNDGPHFH